jgi:hypothetical protein
MSRKILSVMTLNSYCGPLNPDFFSSPRIFPEKHRKPVFSWVKADRITQPHENKKTSQQRIH